MFSGFLNFFRFFSLFSFFDILNVSLHLSILRFPVSCRKIPYLFYNHSIFHANIGVKSSVSPQKNPPVFSMILRMTRFTSS